MTPIVYSNKSDEHFTHLNNKYTIDETQNQYTNETERDHIHKTNHFLQT